MIYSKTSETSKVVIKNERDARFQASIPEMQLKTAKKKLAILNRVTQNERKIEKVKKTQEELRIMGIQSKADYSECYRDFKENVKGIDGKLMANLIDDRLQRDLDRCVNKDQEQIVTEHHKAIAELTLARVKILETFYKEVIEEKKEPAKKSGTRSRKTKTANVKA